jgi:hypothetical protein
MEYTRASVLVAGLPRSGTTWLAQALGRTKGAVYVHEPDNHLHRPYALRTKRGLGAFPSLGPADDAAAYRRMWAHALDGGLQPREGIRARIVQSLLRDADAGVLDALLDSGMSAPVRLRAAAAFAPSPQRMTKPTSPVIVKSVQALLALDWIAHSFDIRVVLIRRHPLNVVASWLEMGFFDLAVAPPTVLASYCGRWGVQPPGADESQLRQLAWRIGFYTAVLEETARVHPDFVHVSHEDLCAAPVAGIEEVARACGLLWTEEARLFIEESNRPGYSYDTHRITAEEPGRWRTRLDDSQVDEIMDALSGLPIDGLDQLPAAGEPLS